MNNNLTEKGHKMLTEPKNVTTRWTHPYGKILGYQVEVVEWTDETFSLLVFTSGARYIDREYLIKDLTGDDNFPTEEEIELRIRETLAEQSEELRYPKDAYKVTFTYSEDKVLGLTVLAQNELEAIKTAIDKVNASGCNVGEYNAAKVHAERI